MRLTRFPESASARRFPKAVEVGARVNMTDTAKLSADLADRVRAAVKALGPVVVKTVNPETANAANSIDAEFVLSIANGDDLKDGKFLIGA